MKDKMKNLNTRKLTQAIIHQNINSKPTKICQGYLNLQRHKLSAECK